MWYYRYVNTVHYLYPLKRLLIHSWQIIEKHVAALILLSKPYLIKANNRLEPVYRFLAKGVIFATYSITASGFDTIPKKGAVLLISNHLSYVDGLIINALCARRVRFVIDDVIYYVPIVHYFMKLNRAIPISARKERIVKAMAEISAGLGAGDVICIFPEGRLSATGFMSHFRPGIEWIIRKNPTPIYPIVLDGLWGSIFSRKYQGSFWRFFPRSIRRKVVAICGTQILPEAVTIDQLHLVMLDLRGKLPK